MTDTPAAAPSPPRSPTAYLPNIQVLRFIAAVMVLYAHLLHETAGHGLPFPTPAHDPTGIAWQTGVDVFFIVSGFIMDHLSRDRFGSAASAADFARRRALRVVPLYWLFTGLTAVAIGLFPDRVIHNELNAKVFAASLAFWPVARIDGDAYPLLAGGWTLEYEMFFYVCFTLALLAPRRIATAALATGLVGFSIAGHWISRDLVALKYFSDPIIVEFLLGMLLARLYGAGVRIGWRLGLAGVVAAFGFMAVMGSRQGLERWVWGGLPAFVLACSLTLAPPIRVRWPTIGGDASYSLYLSHPFVLACLGLVWVKARPPGGPWAFVIVGLIVCTAASLVIYWLVERPLLAVLRRRFEPASAQVPG
jgi:peptidoglycan/LPS O-acetylase OafA/YrhL